MTNPETPRSVFVEARHYYDKTYGNSYFSARIDVNGKTIGYLPLQYGYESAYQHAALKWLQENGYAPKELLSLQQLRTTTDLYFVIYQSTKRDAKRFGQPF